MKGLAVAKIVRGIEFGGVWGELGAGGVFPGATAHGVFGPGSGFRVG